MKTISLCVVLLLCSCTKVGTIKKQFPELIFFPKLEELKIKHAKEMKGEAFTAKKLEFDADSSFKMLFIESNLNINSDRAKELFNNKTLMIKEMYETVATPYSGSVTKEASCLADVQLTPQIVENEKEISYTFNLKATSRLVTGVCLEEQNVYKNKVQLLYCKGDQKFFEISLFYKKDFTLNVDSLASCK